jgi:hypothetical protein
MRNLNVLTARIFILLGLAANVVSAGPDPKHATLKSALGTLELELFFGKPGSFPNHLALSGDFRNKLQPFRIDAREAYPVKAGEFQGDGEDIYIEEMKTGEDHPVIIFDGFLANLANGKGERLILDSPARTSRWKVGTLIIIHNQSSGSLDSATICALDFDSTTRKFPVIPPVVAIGAPLKFVDLRPGPAALIPPDWAREVEVFSLSGRKVWSARIRPAAAVGLPAELSRAGVLHVRYLRR